MTDFTGGEWRSLVDGTVVSAIPDSGDLQARFTVESVSANTDTWSDELGNYNLTGGTASYVDTGTDAPYLDFSGGVSMDTSWPTLSHPITFGLVVDAVDDSTNSETVLATASGGADILIDRGDGTGYNYTFGDGFVSSNSSPSDGFETLVLVGDSANSLLERDNTEIASGDAGNSRGTDGIAVSGGTNPMDLKIKELVVWNKTPDPGQVHDYLTRWF